jgi:hypothetical protein
MAPAAEQSRHSLETEPGEPRLRSAHIRRISVAIFIAALVSVTWQLTTPLASVGFGRYWEAVAVARSLAAGDGFSNPFGALQTGPTAHLAPLFPSMLAGLIRIFGDTKSFAFAAVILCALAHALHCVLFVPLSSALFGDVRPGIWAALFCAVAPTIEVLPQWEAIYAAVASQLFCIIAAKLTKDVVKGWIAGALCGLMLLLNPALLFVAVAWLLYSRPSWRWIAAFTLAAFLVCLPWNLRNYAKFSSVFFIRDNLGTELYASNADCADARDSINHRNGCHLLLQANLNQDEAVMVRDLGEAAYSRLRMAVAVRWIESHPGRFLQLTLSRFREFWFPTPGSAPVLEYSRWLITALSAAGLFALIRIRHRSAWFFCVALALYPLVYYLVQASTRFRSPILWVSALPAAFAASRAASALLERRSRRAVQAEL